MNKKIFVILLLSVFLFSFASATITNTLNSPADDSTFYSNPVTFNASSVVTGGAYLTNMSLWTNESGIWEIKNTSLGDRTTDSGFTNPTNFFDNNSATYASKTQSDSDATWVLGKYWTGDRYIGNITIKSYLGFTDQWTGGWDGNITLKLQSYDGSTWTDVETLYTGISGSSSLSYTYDAVYNFSDNTSGLRISSYFNVNPATGFTILSQNYLFEPELPSPLGFTDATSTIQTWNRTITEDIIWNIQGCDSDGTCEFAPSNYSLFLDAEAPPISITSPESVIDTHSIGNELLLNTTITDLGLDICWYEYNEINTTFSCTSGVLSSEGFNTVTGGQSITVWANDSLGNINSEIASWTYGVLINNNTYNTSTYETASETFKLNLTANSSLTKVILDYNGTDYTMTNSGGIWSKTLDIPLNKLQNNTFKYDFTYAGEAIEFGNFYQNVSETVFTLCNASYTTKFLNVSFKDEGDLSVINATIPTSSFKYYLGSGDVYKTYTYVNNSLNFNYNFCASPNKTMHVDPYMQYKQGTSFPQRIWDAVVQSYNRTLTHKILYLLSSTDGIYVTFQVINSADQVISGIDINATRVIEGETVVVGVGTTSSSGTVTLWLNPDFEHTFGFSGTGYTTYIYSDSPTQTSYTITMGGGSVITTSYMKGVTYSIIPTNSSLINDTIYTFGFELASTYWDVEEFGFDLRLNNGTEITGASASTNGGTLTLDYNTTDTSRIYIDYYWKVNDTYNNGTASWRVYNTDSTQWSIKVFFSDLSSYMDSGLFGLDNFGRYLITFLLIFFTVGILGYKYGINSPLFLTGLLFFIIFFLDVAVGIIPDITVLNGNSVPHLLTFVSGLIFIISIISEVSRR